MHDDFQLQSEGILVLSNKGGAMASGSTKQRLNTGSSTELESFAVDDFHPKLLLTLRFMECQGYFLEMKLCQDNKITITLETKGRSSLGKRSRTISSHQNHTFPNRFHGRGYFY